MDPTASTTGWSGSTVLMIAGAATMLGFLSGTKSGVKKTEKKWMAGLSKTAETGLSHPDLNEQERGALFQALRTMLPAGTIERLDEKDIPGALKEAAEKLLRKAKIYREVKPGASHTEAVLAEVNG